MRRILLVEDDAVIGRSLSISLSLEGYNITIATTLRQAKELLSNQVFDLVLLDVNLPDGNGLTFCAELRSQNGRLPIIMVTAVTDEPSVVKGLQFGANDYIRKPFGSQELLARIQNILGTKKKLCYRSLAIDIDERSVKMDGKSLALGRREFDILTILVRNAENIVSREHFLQELDKDGVLFDRTIDSHLSRLRSKLKKLSDDKFQITSVYGIGYKLEAP